MAVLGGPEFLIRYPNGDVTYYITIAFRGSIVGGSHKLGDGEFSELRYFSQSECDSLNMSPSGRLISKHAFAGPSEPHFTPATWNPGKR
jgi:hypothetical protein